MEDMHENDGVEAKVQRAQPTRSMKEESEELVSEPITDEEAGDDEKVLPKRNAADAQGFGKGQRGSGR